NDTRKSFRLAPPTLVGRRVPRRRVFREAHIVALEMRIEQSEELRVALFIQNLDLDQIAAEDELIRRGRMGRALPGRETPDRETRHQTDVDKPRVVPLDEQHVRVHITQLLAVELTQRV